MESQPKFIVVIGTSAGGINALSELVAQLTAETDAAYFIVMHLSRKGIGDFLVHRLLQQTKLPCRQATHGEEIKQGHIYVSPPDEHMLLEEGKIILGKGPAENRWRPSVNNLFRSAAAAYGERVIGIVLTGFLDDGTAGMSAIKRSGGTCIVQDPNQAEYPDMPLSVLNNMEVDYCIPLAEMGNIIWDITQTTKLKDTKIPQDVITEAAIDRKVSTSISDVEVFDKTVYNCPDCGGGLWITTHDHPTHYRCHVGHSYTEDDLLIRQSETLEATLWTALRMMEERKALLVQMHEKQKSKGLRHAANIHIERANELVAHINNLKGILFETRDPNPVFQAK